MRRTATRNAWLAAAASVAWASVCSGDEKPKPEPTDPPVRASESIVVTATRTEQPAADAPSSLVVFSVPDLDAAAAPTLDDTLRLMPGFTLFRRTGSRVANPTTQGVSLRGLGPSGASRALVLADGLPLNDPFGGWIYWGRVPREAVDRVEVLRGGASDLYGSAALGGVIQILTRPTAGRPSLAAEASLGNEDTQEGSVSVGGQRDGWGGRLSAGGLATDGYILVSEDQRGPVDTPAGVRQATAVLTVDRTLPGGRAFLRGSLFGESRHNGTPLQTNDTDLQQLVAGADWTGARLGSLALRLHAGTQTYDQTFSAVAADRASEALNRRQHVPAQDTGLSLQWWRPLGERQTLVAGLVGREVRGSSDEVAVAAGIDTSAVGAGGRERTLGAFVEDVARLAPRVALSLSLRFDQWRHYRALSTTTPLVGSGPVIVRTFPDREESSFNPRLALHVKATEGLDVTASGYRAFRGPTLNELYRSFRVGDTVTQANENLQAETLWGGELGARWRAGALTVSGTAFWNQTQDPVANVTLSVTPRLITRQRQNLGRTEARGIELDVERRLGQRWQLAAGYAFTDGFVASFPPGPELVGNTLPQLPRHQGSLRFRYDGARLGLSGSVRAVGEQFEDDRNELPLAAFAVVDLTASWRAGASVEAFAAVENLLDERYPVGLTPVATIGPPRLLRAGLRVRLGR
jgi:outer membrane receptor protein involved in Fe transport